MVTRKKGANQGAFCFLCYQIPSAVLYGGSN